VPVKVVTVESIAIVPLVVIVPPLNPVPAVIEVTVPLPEEPVPHSTPVPVDFKTCPFVPTPLDTTSVPDVISRPFLTLKFVPAKVHSPLGYVVLFYATMPVAITL
jgi:hypothetical protein